jgi:hypothetical protein
VNAHEQAEPRRTSDSDSEVATFKNSPNLTACDNLDQIWASLTNLNKLKLTMMIKPADTKQLEGRQGVGLVLFGGLW